ncbi:MAG: class I SAM-dependent methyltransferase [Clostridiaceae bacterium]|jgi:hypothetical protein|nr:class I SAM-dependent methyltransferase [Clostridiaceae bacterium]
MSPTNKDKRPYKKSSISPSDTPEERVTVVPIDEPVVPIDEPEEPIDEPEVPNSHEKKVARYIAHTTVYACLQNNLVRLIKLIQLTNTQPMNILELGFGGNSQTAIKVAKEFKDNIKLTVVNGSLETINSGKMLAENERLSIDFINENVNTYITRGIAQFDLVYLLYNFHHIADSDMEKKHEKKYFLDACYENMKVLSFLCIADAFFPETCDDSNLLADESLEELYKQRATESQLSTFWGVLEGIGLQKVQDATREANDSYELEMNSFVRIKEKNGEYLVKKSWLVKAAQSDRKGFAVIINKDVNCIGDAILLFKKIR